jgi:nitronate monooxygenase
MHTPLCDVLGMDDPAVQAPVGGATCPDLAAGVSNAGGLGHLAVTWRPPERTRGVVEETRRRSEAPFAVNLVVEPDAQAHDAGATVIVTVASADEARKAVEAGADGVWLGTRFVATAEAAVAGAYRDRVVAADAADAVRTGLFDVGWPDQPHRVLRNSTVEAWEAAGRPPSGERPGEGEPVGAYPRPTSSGTATTCRWPAPPATWRRWRSTPASPPS